MYIIETQGLRKAYQFGEVLVEAVRGVDLRVEEGSLLAIMGPSGSGKSTLLYMLGGIETPSEGKVLLEGTDLASLSDDRGTMLRRQRIGFIFQTFNLLPTLTAQENVALPLRLDGARVAAARQLADAMLELVGMGHRRTHLPSMLSGGEQQRVAIARALIGRPALLLADEPTGNLDSVNGRQITAMLRDLVSEHRQTIVMVTHDGEVAKAADRVVHLRDGRVEDSLFLRNRFSCESVPAMTLWAFTVREIQRRPGRAALTLLSIVLGVAAVISVSLATTPPARHIRRCTAPWRAGRHWRSPPRRARASISRWPTSCKRFRT